MCFSWLLPHSLTLRLALWNILAHLELKVTGWELIFFFFFFAYNLSPLVSSFPSVRRCCHPSLGPRQWYNGSVWGLATDTITWVADKVLLPGPTKAKQLLIQTGPFPLLQMTMKVDCELYKANTLLMRFSIPSRFRERHHFSAVLHALEMLRSQTALSHVGPRELSTIHSQHYCHY